MTDSLFYLLGHACVCWVTKQWPGNVKLDIALILSSAKHACTKGLKDECILWKHNVCSLIRLLFIPRLDPREIKSSFASRTNFVTYERIFLFLFSQFSNSVKREASGF